MNPESKKWSLIYIGGEIDSIVQAEVMDKSYISLSSGTIGSKFAIAQIHLKNELKHRLAKLGFVQGTNIELISRTSTGSVVVQMQNQKIGLGALLAKNILALQSV